MNRVLIISVLSLPVLLAVPIGASHADAWTAAGSGTFTFIAPDGDTCSTDGEFTFVYGNPGAADDLPIWGDALWWNAYIGGVLEPTGCYPTDSTSHPEFFPDYWGKNDCANAVDGFACTRATSGASHDFILHHNGSFSYELVFSDGHTDSASGVMTRVG